MNTVYDLHFILSQFYFHSCQCQTSIIVSCFLHCNSSSPWNSGLSDIDLWCAALPHGLVQTSLHTHMTLAIHIEHTSIITSFADMVQPQVLPILQVCNAVGTIDGSHIPTLAPASSHSKYWNRKGFLSQNALFACSFVGMSMGISGVYPAWPTPTPMRGPYLSCGYWVTAWGYVGAHPAWVYPTVNIDWSTTTAHRIVHTYVPSVDTNRIPSYFNVLLYCEIRQLDHLVKVIVLNEVETAPVAKTKKSAGRFGR